MEPDVQIGEAVAVIRTDDGSTAVAISTKQRWQIERMAFLAAVAPATTIEHRAFRKVVSMYEL